MNTEICHLELKVLHRIGSGFSLNEKSPKRRRDKVFNRVRLMIKTQRDIWHAYVILVKYTERYFSRVYNKSKDVRVYEQALLELKLLC